MKDILTSQTAVCEAGECLKDSAQATEGIELVFDKAAGTNAIVGPIHRQVVVTNVFQSPVPVPSADPMTTPASPTPATLDAPRNYNTTTPVPQAEPATQPRKHAIEELPNTGAHALGMLVLAVLLAAAGTMMARRARANR